MRLSPNQVKALDYIKQHPEGVIPNDMKHLFEGDIGRARSVGYQLWKKDQVLRKEYRTVEARDWGRMTAKRVRYYPLQEEPESKHLATEGANGI